MLSNQKSVFLSNLQQPDLLQDMFNMGDKMRDIIFQIALQQRCRTRYTFLLPVLL